MKNRVIKSQRKRARKGKKKKKARLYKKDNNKQRGNFKPLPIKNHFKCKWIKFSHQKIYSNQNNMLLA